MDGKSGQGPGTSMSKGHEPRKSLAVTELEEAGVQSAEPGRALGTTKVF